MDSVDVIISIKQQFCKEIYAGRKTVELRKRIGRGFVPGVRLYIYTSGVGGGVSGEALVSGVETLLVEDIKAQCLGVACISELEFDAYYRDSKYGSVIYLKKVIRYGKIIPLSDLRGLGFTPPQSFLYASGRVKSYLDSQKCI